MKRGAQIHMFSTLSFISGLRRTKLGGQQQHAWEKKFWQICNLYLVRAGRKLRHNTEHCQKLSHVSQKEVAMLETLHSAKFHH